MSGGTQLRVVCLIDSVVGAGAERSLAQLVPEYAARGVAVDVAYLRDEPGLQDAFERGGATLFCLEGPGGRAGWMRRTRALIASRRPSLVHTTLFEANVAGRVAAALTGVPVVSTLAGLNYGADHRAAPHLAAWKVRGAQVVDAATARLVRRFHAVATHVADAMAPRLRVPRGRIDVVPRGRDPKELGLREPERRAAVRKRLGISPDERLILAAARHDRKKGLDVLLDAFPMIRSEVPGAVLVLAGADGNLTPALRVASARLNLDGAARFLGARADVPDLLCAADAFVLPSRSEGFPGVLVEAMALEAPIVASDIPAVREAVGDGVALLAPAEDPGGLAGAVRRALVDPVASAARAARGRARFLERFAIGPVAEAMLAFYARALGHSGDGRIRPVRG